MFDKIEFEEIVLLSCKYLFVNFKVECEMGNDLLIVENFFVIIDGEKIFDNISFIFCFGDKIVFIG